ncbi:MAG: DUF2147 domain-containing protein, partial [Alphaproteobacteria bacterium]|nr:DUF2147 domain-containing protein [Alphaproteobacteria bacterium]
FVTLASAAQADPSGLWREKDGGTVRVGRCGAAYCAWIASVIPATDPETGKPRTDRNNPDPTKRNRPLVGVQVLFDMTPSGDGRWSGRLYDSDRGETFNGRLRDVNESTIKIEGCSGSVCGGELLSRVR